jgi:uncharacterized protein
MHNCDIRGDMTAPLVKSLRLDTAILSRTLPFVLFMSFIALDESLRLASQHGWLALSATALYYLYPVKTISVAALLWRYRGEYRELAWRDLREWQASAAVLAVGVLTCVMWVSMDWTVSVTGAPGGFDPRLLPQGAVRVLMTLARVAGAVLVVPLMEELFWRSFLLRYLVAGDFQSVPLGRFTWASFLTGAILFGLEHHLFLAGVAAGAVFSLILYKTRSIAQCVLAHAVTNLALACYVLHTGKWYFW